MRLTIKRKGVEYVLKTCVGCGDEWYAKRKQNRCTLCGSGLVRRTPANLDVPGHDLRDSGKVSRRLRKDEVVIEAAVTLYGRS